MQHLLQDFQIYQEITFNGCFAKWGDHVYQWFGFIKDTVYVKDNKSKIACIPKSILSSIRINTPKNFALGVKHPSLL